MMYHAKEISEYCESEDIKFIRLCFCDIYGRQKNISIMPSQLERAFESGIAFDGSAVRGFGRVESSDLFLMPDPDTLTILPWRPEQQRVARMYCSVVTPDGGIHECDTRNILKKAVKSARENGLTLMFGHDHEFGVFDSDNGKKPADRGGYMDMAPLDRCENYRRELCLTLEKMGMKIKGSHHGDGYGRNRISLGSTDALKAADDTMTFITAARAVAESFGLTADISDMSLHITLSFGGERPGNVISDISKIMKDALSFLDTKNNSQTGISINIDDDLIRADIVLRFVHINPYLLFAAVIDAAVCCCKGSYDTTRSFEFSLPEQIAEMYNR